MIIDMNEGIPMDGYYIDELPQPKLHKPKSHKEKKEFDLNLELEIHDFSQH